MNIVPANQRVPAHYLNRKFAIHHNLPKLAKLADPARSFPSLPTNAALALAALSLARLEVALTGAGQADDGVNAGSVAAWAVELAAARTDAAAALAAVKAAFPSFATGVDISAALQNKAALDLGKAKYAAPSQLSTGWFTGNVAPLSADPIVTTVTNNVAISKNLVTLSTAADADSDVIKVKSLNGEVIDYDNGNPNHTFKVDGKTFTFVKATQLLTAPGQTATHTWAGTYVLMDDEGGETAELAWSVQNLANNVPTANNIVTTVANNTAINKDFLALSAAADADTAGGQTLRISEFCGVAVPVGGAATVNATVDGVVFTLTKATGVVTAPAQAVAHTYAATFKVADSSTGETAAKNWSIEVLA